MIPLVIINSWIFILLIFVVGYAFWSFVFSLLRKDKNKNVLKDTSKGCLAGLLTGALGIVAFITIIVVIGLLIVFFFAYGFSQM